MFKYYVDELQLQRLRLFPYQCLIHHLRSEVQIYSILRNMLYTERFKALVQFLRSLLGRSLGAENVNKLLPVSPLFPSYEVFTLMSLLLL
jgi:hypothetical protein